MSADGDPIGKVTDYFWKRQTVRIEVRNGTVQEGDRLHVKGEFTDNVIEVKDMTVDEESVDSATEGEIFAMPLEMKDRVVIGDEVYRADADDEA